MPIRDEIIALAKEATLWRHALHRNPQTSYEEVFARDMIKQKLSAWDIPFEENWAKTGIVATLEGQNKSSGKTIGLRADIDALNIIEKQNKPWVSQIHGKMHGCGHDGHTTMLLAAAFYLNKNPNFNGTVHFIFQPAEESVTGAITMIEEGLFTKHPMDAVYGMHNWPWLDAGKIALCPGPIMASDDVFYATFTGKGGHAAMPHRTKDPIPALASAILAIQTLVSREIDPMDTAVISITNIHAGTGADNVLPDQAELVGCVRSLEPETRAKIETRLKSILEGVAQSYELDLEFKIDRLVMATVNDAQQAAFCAQVARNVVGEKNVEAHVKPAMTAEDFGAMLAEVPGCYIWLGQSSGDVTACCNNGLHASNYDFNDDVIAIGCEYWVKLVETALPLLNNTED